MAAKKIGVSYAVNDIAGSYDGGTAGTDTSATLPTPTQARLGFEGTNYINGWLTSVTFYNTAKSDAELQGLTAGILSVTGSQVTLPCTTAGDIAVVPVGAASVTGAQTTLEATTAGDITLGAVPPANVTGAQTTLACTTTGIIGDVQPEVPEQPVAPGGPSRAAQRRLKQAVENRSRFEAERARRLASLTNDRPLFVTPPETLEMINETLVEDIDHSVLFENEDQDEELLSLLMMI